ncbi:MAG TPA: MBL fold metallo-hydrolase [Thermoanaerobaculia bacterium]|nr:MBL fold metallo-hydrolase [Thermoanaerobaculia bacterium]
MEKDFCRLQTAHFVIEGSSRAGHESYFRIRELGVALDIGRCPDLVVPMEHVFVTHAHLDHAAGIPFYAAQRKLQQLEAGTVYVPAESREGFEELLAVQRRLTGSALALEIVGLAAGEEARFGRNHLVRAHAATHRVAARAYELFDVRHHLREEFLGMGGEEIGRLRREGVTVDEPYARSLLFYTGDTDRGLLESCEALFRSEVLMMECSFVLEGHQDRAAQYRHLHIDDIADFADRFENELIVLTHFSRRYSRDEIRTRVRRRLPVSLHDRVRLALPEQWQRI